MERIIKFNNNYSVTDDGIIYSLHYGKKIARSLILSKNGYFDVKIKNEHGRVKSYRVHRIVAAAFVKNPNDKPIVNHKNGIKTDNRFENLEWVTSSENMIHALATGLRGNKYIDHSYKNN